MVEPTSVEVALKRREALRHSFVLVAGVDIRLKGRDRRAHEVICAFIRDLARVRALEYKMEKWWVRVSRLSRQLKRVSEVR